MDEKSYVQDPRLVLDLVSATRASFLEDITVLSAGRNSDGKAAKRKISTLHYWAIHQNLENYKFYFQNYWNLNRKLTYS